MYFDIVEDYDNYNHWLPLVLLLIEFHINNIQFSWKHMLIFGPLMQIYVLVNASYCFYYEKTIYPGIDWINNWPNAFAKLEALCLVHFLFFLVARGATKLKYKCNRLEKKINF